MKAFVCIDGTGDGPVQFAVDSRETFDAIVALDKLGCGASESRNGLEFDIDPTDEDYMDCYDNNIDPATVEPITLAKIAEVRTETGCDEADETVNYGDEAETNPFEAAFMTMVHGW